MRKAASKTCNDAFTDIAAAAAAGNAELRNFDLRRIACSPVGSVYPRPLPRIAIGVRPVGQHGGEPEWIGGDVAAEARVVMPVPVIRQAVLQLEPLAGEAHIVRGRVFGDIVHLAERQSAFA